MGCRCGRSRPSCRQNQGPVAVAVANGPWWLDMDDGGPVTSSVVFHLGDPHATARGDFATTSPRWSWPRVMGLQRLGWWLSTWKEQQLVSPP